MADTGLSTAQRQLAHGSKYPYDGGSEAAPAIDWAHAAARGVMADLLDRRGGKWELEKVDLDARTDIVTAVAAIVRAAAPSPSTALVKDHVVREVVNQLRDTALEFHAHGSLRERLARELEPLLVASRPAEVDEAWVLLFEALPHISPQAVNWAIARVGPIEDACINTRIRKYLERVAAPSKTTNEGST